MDNVFRIADLGIRRRQLMRCEKAHSITSSAMATNDADRPVVKAIIGSAHALNIHLIAEQVETAAQAKFLCDLGCSGAQGFAFSRPLPVADITAILRRKKVFALLDRSVLPVVA